MGKPFRVLILLIIASAGLTISIFNYLGSSITQQLMEFILQVRYVSEIIIRSSDQSIVWTSLILIVTIFGLVTIKNLRRKPDPQKEGGIDLISSLERWDDLLRSTSKGFYFQWRLSQQLGTITLETLAQRNGLTTQQTIEKIMSDHLETPKKIRDYLIAARNPKMVRDLLAGFISNEMNHALSFDPGIIVDFLEENIQWI